MPPIVLAFDPDRDHPHTVLAQVADPTDPSTRSLARDAGFIRALFEAEYLRADVQAAGRGLPPFPGVRVTGATRRMGSCRTGVDRHGRRQLRSFTISRNHAHVGALLDTVRHEIAHAAAFVLDGHLGHGGPWQRWAQRLGARPRRCHDGVGETVCPEAHEAAVIAYRRCPNGCYERPYLRISKKLKRPHGWVCRTCQGSIRVDWVDPRARRRVTGGSG